MDKQVLEVVLKRCARDSKIERVTELEATPALPKGENYSSKILQLRVKVILGNGRTSNKSLIVKQIITNDKLGEWTKKENVAKKEAEIYSFIHKEMTYLMEEFQDTEETLWCRFYHYDPLTSSLYFEDLKSIGYKLVPRQMGFDLDHSILALRGLARYHGMAKVIEQRGIINKDNYKPSLMFTDRSIIKCFLHAGVQNTAKALKTYWGHEWKEPAEKLAVDFDQFANKIMSLGKPLDSEFTVLNHGDCWSNNIMFKYDWRNRPVAVKFVDYQLPHYSTSSIDVTNFMYFSIQPAVRRQNYHLLLQGYHNCLVDTLDRFGYTGARPSLQDIISSMERMSFFGLSMFVGAYALLVCTSSEAIDVEQMMESEGKTGFNTEVLNEPGMVEKMGPDIIDYIQKHLSTLTLNKNNS